MLIIIQSILLVAEIILAALLVKKEKLFKMRYLIIGEVILLIINLIIGAVIFNLSLESTNTSMETTMINTTNEAINCNYTETPISTYNTVLSTYTYGQNPDNFKNFYLEMEVYDSDGNQIFSSDELNNVLIMYTFEDNESTEMTLFNLNDYFTEEQLTDLIGYYNSDERFGQISVENIKGHYDEDHQFIITEMDLAEGLSPEITYLFGQADEDDLMINANSYLVDNCHQFCMYLLNTSEDTRLAAAKYKINAESLEMNGAFLLRQKAGNNEIYRGIFNDGNEDQKIILNLYVDTLSIVLRDTSLRSNIIGVMSLTHTLPIIMIVLFSKYITKKRKLDQDRDTFINAMAHEMKTPAAVIQNSSEMLKENLYPEKKDHYLDMIQEEAIHLNDLLGKMLTYTRTNDTYVLNIQEVNLLNLVNDCLKHYDICQELSVDISPDMIIQCDIALMSMVIDNFISNAIKHSDHLITIQYTDHTFTVYNSGSTIIEEDAKHIWEPLYQIDSSRNDTRSSGMGLAISANILNLHGFKYGMHQLSDGVEFYFTIK